MPKSTETALESPQGRSNPEGMTVALRANYASGRILGPQGDGSEPYGTVQRSSYNPQGVQRPQGGTQLTPKGG